MVHFFFTQSRAYPEYNKLYCFLILQIPLKINKDKDRGHFLNKRIGLLNKKLYFSTLF